MTGLSFTERMTGRVARGEHDPETGGRTGAAAAVHLTITIDDVDAFVGDPAHAATVTGRVESDAVGGRWDVHDGRFHLFVPGPAAGARRMVYRLPFTDDRGRRYTLAGVKEVRDDPGPDLWPDTTTLFTRLLDGDDPAPGTSSVSSRSSDDADAARTVGAGVLRIGETDLLRQLTTFRTTGPHGAAALVRFGRFFLGRLWDVYGPHAADPNPAGHG